MEIIKSLPDVFEEFSEQRRNSFLAVKDFKETGTPVIGAYCSYFPQELAMAAGAAPVGLCSMSDEPISEAEKELPANLCPLIKSSYGFAKADKCPFFHFSDLVVGETTCDGKKKMYELMGQFKDVYLMKLPNSQDADAAELWRKEVVKMKECIEEKFGVEITDEKLREAVKLKNRERIAQKRFSDLMMHDPAPITGVDLFNTVYGSTFKFDKEQLIEELDAVTDKVEKEYAEGKHLDKRPRILVTGCPMGGGSLKVIRAVEDNGGVVVALEDCSGYKLFDRLVDEDADDIIGAVADRYLKIGCSVMTPDDNRFELLGRLMDQFNVDGVLEMTLSTCLTYDIEASLVEKFVAERGKPYLKVETDFSNADIAQLNTRISAFLEMM
jgi:benzoyl-CoA reductase/2-hydroxyglutaryl-CoA dehydratase subunit BcrC/BadD/HgdB